MENKDSTRADQAVSARLRKLSALPVDLSRLERQIQREIPRSPRRPVLMRLFRPISAIAASITILIVVAAALLTSSSSEVMASPAQMAQFHRDIVANKVAVTKVDSIEAAGQVLAQQSPDSPALPQAPDTHVMACCMKSIKDKKVACVLLKREGIPVTLTVAKASDMQLPKSPKVDRNGVSYHVQSSGTLNMVMTERQGRWVCLIGELGSDRLMDLADQLRFQP